MFAYVLAPFISVMIFVLAQRPLFTREICVVPAPTPRAHEPGVFVAHTGPKPITGLPPFTQPKTSTMSFAAAADVKLKDKSVASW
jgi:hypothetical protein